MDSINANRRFLELAKIMSVKLADSCSPRFIKNNFKQIITEESSYLSEIQELKRILSEYEKEIESYKKLENLKTKLDEKDKKINELENVIQSLKEDKISIDIKELLMENEKLKTKIYELTEENDQLKSQLDQVKHINQNYISLIDSLENRLCEASNKSYAHVVECQKLRKLLLNERNKIKTLEAEKKELISTVRRLENRLLMGGNTFGLVITSTPMEEVSREGDNAVQFKAELKRMNIELSRKNERIKNLELELRDLKEKMAHADTAELQARNEQLTEELEKKNSIILDFKTLRKKMMVQIKNLQNRITDLQNQLLSRTEELEESKKMINELETVVRTGVKDASARELIAKLQHENENLRSELRAMDSALRAQDKSYHSLQQQIKALKSQVNKLYNQSKWQLSQIHRYHDILERAGIDPADYGLDTQKLTTSFKKALQGAESTSSEISEKDNKIKQLESYITQLENEINEINFKLMSRDVKINELENIINDIKVQFANKGLKIKI